MTRAGNLDVADAVRLLPAARVMGAGRGDIASLVYDSRAVVPGSLFAAIPGSEADGHRFIPNAVAAGALVILSEWEPEEPLPPDVTCLIVADSRRALASLAAAYYGDPGNTMALVGITGTNGKTSITYMLESILTRSGETVGAIGTTGFRLSGRTKPSTHTTPEGPELQRQLAEAAEAGASAVVMEISSHGLQQGRAVGCPLDVAAFTNLSRDHLDYHGDMDLYFAAKCRIVTELLESSPKANRWLVVNVDDPRGEQLAALWPRVIRTTAGDGVADVRPVNVSCDLDGIHGALVTPAGTFELDSPLVGQFNLANITVAVGIATALGAPLEEMAAGLHSLRRIPGRLEPVEWARGSLDETEAPRVLVDYAHTSDALQRVLESLRPLVSARIWTVFGCGGDRDRGKRELMGAAAAAGSDELVVTSDNPRSEDPRTIIDDILPGVRTGGTPFHVEVDRRRAIEYAVNHADPADLVLIAGKGHERVQVVGNTEIPFVDQAVAREALRLRTEI